MAKQPHKIARTCSSSTPSSSTPNTEALIFYTAVGDRLNRLEAILAGSIMLIIVEGSDANY